MEGGRNPRAMRGKPRISRRQRPHADDTPQPGAASGLRVPAAPCVTCRSGNRGRRSSGAAAACGVAGRRPRLRFAAAAPEPCLRVRAAPGCRSSRRSRAGAAGCGSVSPAVGGGSSPPLRPQAARPSIATATATRSASRPGRRGRILRESSLPKAARTRCPASRSNWNRFALATH